MQQTRKQILSIRTRQAIVSPSNSLRMYFLYFLALKEGNADIF